MSKNLSLTNSKDLLVNSLSIITENDYKDIFEIFLTKAEGYGDIVGLSPEDLNSLQELAAALNNDSDFFNSINSKIALKADIATTYDKIYINNLIDNYYPKSTIENSLLGKLDKTIINNYYTKIQSDNLLTPYYTSEKTNELLALKAYTLDVYNKVSTNALLNLKLDISTYDSGILLKANKADVYTKDVTYTQSELNVLLNNKLNIGITYDKLEIDNMVNLKVDSSLFNTSLNLKANIENVYYKPLLYTKDQVNNLLNNKISTTALNSYYTMTQINSSFENHYSKSYVDTLINNYYLKAEVNTLISNNTSSILTDNIIIDDDMLVIKGGIGGIRLRDFNNNNMIKITPEAVTCTPKFICGTAQFLGDITAVNIYNKNEITTLLNGKLNSSVIDDYNTKAEIISLINNYYLKSESDDNLNNLSILVNANTLNINGISTDILNRYTKVESDNIYYNKTLVDSLLNDINNLISLKLNITDYNTAINNYYSKIESDDKYTTKVYNAFYNYTKLEVDALVNTKVYISDFNTGIDTLNTNIAVNTFDINTSNILISSGLTNRYTKSESDNRYYDKATVDSSLNLKQNLLNSGEYITLNVGRGDIRLENNLGDVGDNSGSGICLRALSNPSNGSIFSVKSAGSAGRLWVGQSLTSTAHNNFGIFKMSVDTGTSDYSIATDYAHYFTGTGCNLTGTVDILGDIVVSNNISTSTIDIGAGTIIENTASLNDSMNIIHTNGILMGISQNKLLTSPAVILVSMEVTRGVHINHDLQVENNLEVTGNISCNNLTCDNLISNNIKINNSDIYENTTYSTLNIVNPTAILFGIGTSSFSFDMMGMDTTDGVYINHSLNVSNDISCDNLSIGADLNVSNDVNITGDIDVNDYLHCNTIISNSTSFPGTVIIDDDLIVTKRITSQRYLLDAYASVDSTPFDSETMIVPIDTIAYISPGVISFIMQADGVILFNRNMVANISFKISIDVDSGINRTSTNCFLEVDKNDGNGFVAISHSGIYLYNRDLNHGFDTSGSNVIMDVQAGYKIRLKIYKFGNNTNYIKSLAYGCSISIFDL